MGDWDGLEVINHRIWAGVRWFGGGFKEVGFTVDWILSGSGDDSMIGYFPTSYLEGRKTSLRLKLQFGKAAAVIHISSGEGGADWVIFVCVFVSRHCSGVVLFLSWSTTVAEWPCLMSLFCEIVSTQQENARAQLWASGELPCQGLHCSFSASNWIELIFSSIIFLSKIPIWCPGKASQERGPLSLNLWSSLSYLHRRHCVISFQDCLLMYGGGLNFKGVS